MNYVETPDMTQPGWYPDTRDAAVSHYWSGTAWTARRVWTGTQYVLTSGMNSIDSPSTNQRSPKVKLAIAGGVLAAAVAVTLTVSLSGGGSGGHGFCADAVSIGRQARSIQAQTAGPGLTSVASHLAGQLDMLAAESPSPQNAADLHYTARWFSYVASGNFAAVQAGKARATAASDRAGAYITDQCG